MQHLDHLINPAIIAMTQKRLAGMHKRAFVPGGDPSMMGGAPPGGAPPGGDPMAGGMPPGGDPSMMGGDPSMMGGMPPPGGDPSMMGAPPPPPPAGGGGDPGLTAKLDQILQALQGGIGGQSGSNMAGQLKPKIDVNVEIMQIKNMLAKIVDALHIPIQAQDMVATPEKLTQMAQAQQSGGQQDSAMAGGGAGAIGGMDPMQGMQGSGAPGQQKQSSANGTYRERGEAYAAAAKSLGNMATKAAAIHKIMQARRQQ